MKFTFVSKKDPCTACKFIRKKCTWQSDDAEECDQCIERLIECVEGSDTDLHLTKDGDKELQIWTTVIQDLNAKMDQVEDELEQSLVKATSNQGPFEWKLSLTNGTIDLETPIRTMEELFQFTQASIQYLSPFSGLFTKQPVRFESESISIALGISAQIQRRELGNQRRSQLPPMEYVDTKLSATFDYRIVIDGLVMLYLEHYNPYTGVVHRSTFLKRYHSLDDPMDDPVTLSVCIDGLCTLLHKISYTPAEVRMLADMFYNRCRDLLFDMYDDSSQKLSVVVVSSLIQKYVGDVRLNDREANRLVTLALLVCEDLANSKMSPADFVTFQRCHLRLQLSNISFLMIHNDRIDFSIPPTMKKMEVLDDEPEVTKEYIHMTNAILQFMGSPYIAFILGKVNSVFYGRPCDILMEDVVRFEPTIRSCWDKLPLCYQLCRDPFDPNAYKLVQGTVPARYLIPFAAVHLVTGIITSSLLQPNIISVSSGNNAVEETMEVVKRKLRWHAVNSCKVIVYALKENWVPSADHLPYFGMTAMRYGIYCLEKIAGCQELEFPTELLHMLKTRLDTKSKSLFPAGHDVQITCSLFNTYNAQRCSRSPFETYDQTYSLPGFALLSDIFVSSLHCITKNQEQNI